MSSKLVSAVAVAALLVLAGCAGLSPGDATTTTAEPTTTTTAEPTTTTTQATTTKQVRLVAPGVSENGVVDAFRLGSAHADTLRLNSYTVVHTTKTTNAAGNVTASTKTVAKHGASAAAGTKTVDGTQTAAFYVENGTGALKTGDGEYASIGSATDAWAQTPGQWREDVYAVAAASDMTVERFETESGKVRYRLTATDPTKLVSVPNDAENASVTMVVSSIGVVNEYTITYQTTENGSQVTHTETVAFTNLEGTSPDEPAWFQNATA